MDLIKNWKLHLLAVLIVCVAEWIGMPSSWAASSPGRGSAS